MGDITARVRKERIERLLHELEYEVVRGVMEHEIEPDFQYVKIFPCTGRGDNLAQLRVIVAPAKEYDLGVARQPSDGFKLRLVE